VSVSQIAVMVASVVKPVRDQRIAARAAGSRVTISRTLPMASRHATFRRYEDADARACSRGSHPGMHAVRNQRGHTSAQLNRVAATLTTWVHPDRQGGTGTAADRCDVES
jgi:hypothetical protein